MCDQMDKRNKKNEKNLVRSIDRAKIPIFQLEKNNLGALPMLDAIVTKLKEFREKFYQILSHRRDATVELIDSLSSNTTAKSIVELSLNPLHRRNYCSITRVLDECMPMNESIEFMKKTVSLLSEACPKLNERFYHVLAVDCTPNPRVFSPTLEDRSYVYVTNTIAENKPVTIGHQYSVVAYLPEKNEKSPPWLVPLSCERVHTNEKAILVGMKQISQCIQSQKEFSERPLVSVGDSAYSHPSCLIEANHNPNQIHIARVRNNRTFYYENDQIKEFSQKGRPQCYGNKHSLKDEKTWRNSDEHVEFEVISKKGYLQTIKIDCWNKMMMRGKQQEKMFEKTFRLIRIRVYRSTGELLFKRPMWLITSGEKHFTLSLQEIFNIYRQRFDIEHFFRFGKNKLLLNKLQTPDSAHEETWWQLVMIAYSQLYLARNIAKNTVNPWEKYLPSQRLFQEEKSPSQVQRDFQAIIREIGTPAKAPKPRNKAIGRKQGMTQPKRLRYPIVFKGLKSVAEMHNST
jgi:DDE superfamily endonuclease